MCRADAELSHPARLVRLVDDLGHHHLGGARQGGGRRRARAAVVHDGGDAWEQRLVVHVADDEAVGPAASEQRLPVGQLLGLMLRRFRADLFAWGQEAGYTNLRQSHLQVFGNIDWMGTRLTDLAARAAMTRPSMLELVDELVKAGYLERRPDERDGRAKLICLTRDGRRVVAQALRAVRNIERIYADEVGAVRFEEACLTLQELLRQGSTSMARPKPSSPRELGPAEHL